jgi:hypothetical protein
MTWEEFWPSRRRLMDTMPSAAFLALEEMVLAEELATLESDPSRSGMVREGHSVDEAIDIVDVLLQGCRLQQDRPDGRLSIEAGPQAGVPVV